jgi:hypothetical protein
LLLVLRMLEERVYRMGPARWSSFAKCLCSLYLGVCSGGVCGAECLQTELNVVIFEPSRTRDRAIKCLLI